jgi:Taurine catabolism dioxygenase TauD, TfdA family
MILPYAQARVVDNRAGARLASEEMLPAPSLAEPWSLRDQGGDARFRIELDDQGWSFFHAPDLCEIEPVELARLLFGGRPVRARRQIVAPVPEGHPNGVYWATTGEALLHTDPPPSGVLPPSAIVMMCLSPAECGGDALLLDTWRTLHAIEAADAALFDQLFDAPRRLRFGQLDHWGTTFSLRRGHFLCLHATRDHDDDPVGAPFRGWLDRSPTVRLPARAGDVFVTSNHRCLHGRTPFEDRGRRFLRDLYWFAEPFAAPPAFVDRAARARVALAADLAGEPAWLRRRFGVDASPASPAALERLRAVLEVIADPCKTIPLPLQEDRETARLLDTLLSRGLPGLEEDVPSWDEREDHARAVLEGLQRAGAR